MGRSLCARSPSRRSPDGRSSRACLAPPIRRNVESAIEHIAVAQSIDLLLVAPATANCLGKLANGVADDFLTTLYLATKAPVVAAPAMNVNMWEHPATRENVERLRSRGVHIVEPEAGYLACGMTGPGRLASVEAIVAKALDVLGIRQDLNHEVVLVTAGPTREAIDPVRFLSNRSSGKMGYAVAEAAKRRGARVILISGPVALTQPAGTELVKVTTSDEMLNAVINRLPEADIVVMSAAVSDFKPAEVSDSKIKKENLQYSGKGMEGISLNLVKTQDILSEISCKKGKQFIAGFAAETDNVVANAKNKLISKGLDMIVANDITRTGAGFEVDTNIVTLIDRWGGVVEYPIMTKKEIADKILDHIAQFPPLQGEGQSLPPKYLSGGGDGI